MDAWEWIGLALVLGTLAGGYHLGASRIADGLQLLIALVLLCSWMATELTMHHLVQARRERKLPDAVILWHPMAEVVVYGLNDLARFAIVPALIGWVSGRCLVAVEPRKDGGNASPQE